MTNVFLPINRAEIGAWRAARIFQACRAFAREIAPRCEIGARYEERERIGWAFTMPSEPAAEALRQYHRRVMAAPS